MHNNESSIYQKLFCADQTNEGNFNAYIRKISYKINGQFPKKKARRNSTLNSWWLKEGSGKGKNSGGKQGNRHGNDLCESGFFEKVKLRIRISDWPRKVKKKQSSTSCIKEGLQLRDLTKYRGHEGGYEHLLMFDNWLKQSHSMENKRKSS